MARVDPPFSVGREERKTRRADPEQQIQDAPVDGSGIPFVYATPIGTVDTSSSSPPPPLREEEQEYVLNREDSIDARPPALNPASSAFNHHDNNDAATSQPQPGPPYSQQVFSPPSPPPPQQTTTAATTIPSQSATTLYSIPPPVPPVGVTTAQSPFQTNQPLRPSTTSTSSCPPNGVADGGVWGQGPVIGPRTWGICAMISIVTCFFSLFPCGICAFCCPCDKRMLYKVHGKVYDTHGRYIGKARRVRFKPL